jgi:putative ABC transport system permease protein
MRRLLGQISLRHFRASWGRTLLVVSGTATGVAMIVAIRIINASVIANFEDTVEMIAGPAQLEVTLGVGEVGFPEETAERVSREDPEVVFALPVIRGTLGLAERHDEVLPLIGVDLQYKEELEGFGWVVLPQPEDDRRQSEDESAWLTDPLSAAVTKTLAAELGLALGDRLPVSTPTGVHELTVRALLEDHGIARAFGGRLALMDLHAAQPLLGRIAQVDQIDLVLRCPEDESCEATIERVRGRLQTALGSALNVARPSTRGAVYEGILGSFQSMITGLSLLCLVAGLYIIYNTTSTGAVHRALLIARLRIIGADVGQLRRLLILESLFIAFVGTILGVLAGAALAPLLSGMVSNSLAVIFQIRFPLDEIHVDLPSQIPIALLGVGSAVVASYFAARRVTSLDPLEVMRVDLRSLASGDRSLAFLVGWGALLVASVTAIALQIRLQSALWGNIGSTLWFASSIVIAVPLVGAIAPFCSRLLGRVFGVAGRIAADGLFGSKTRTGVTVAAVALVVNFAVTVASLSESHSKSVRSYFDGGVLSSDLAISAVTTEGGWLEIPIPGSLAQRIAKLEGVDRVDVLRMLPGASYRDPRTSTISRIALVALSRGILEAHRVPRDWFQDGDPETAASAARGGAALVSLNFANRFRTKRGDRITLETPTGPLTLRVAGIMRDYASDRGAIFLSQRLFRKRWKDDAVNWILVSLDDKRRAAESRQDVLDLLGDQYRLKVHLPGERAAFHEEKIDSAYSFVSAIQLLVVLVTVAGIVDLLLAAIWERRRELALWRVVGAEDETILRAITIESATVGLLGVALGAGVGVITAWIWIRANYRHLVGFIIEYHFALATTLTMALLVLLTTVATGYVAARYALRQSVLDGIQAE